MLQLCAARSFTIVLVSALPGQVAVDGALTDVPAAATTYVDNDNGDDSTGARGSQILPFKTLAVAFTQALSGDVIYVSPGTYDQGTRHW